MRLILTCFFLFLIQSIEAQTLLKEVTDIEQEESKAISGLKFQDKIIFVGKAFETSYIPTMVCIDSNGTELWNTALNDATTNYIVSSANYQSSLILGVDGFIYSSGMKNSLLELWKVNPTNGVVIWKKQFTGMTYGEDYLKDYDSTHFLISHSTYYNGLNYTKVLDLIDKSTGLVTKTKNLGNYYNSKTQYSIVLDNNKNIYYSIHDTVKKIDANNWNSILWQVKYTSIAISEIPTLYYNVLDGKIVALAIKTSNKQNHFLKIDAQNGAYLTMLPVNVYDNKVTQVTMRNNALFISFQHNTVGGNSSYFSILKYNLNTYNLAWLEQNDFFSSQQAIRSFDFDDSDNIFCTGYFNSSNYGPGKWGILKLSPSGTPLYSQHVYRDSLNSTPTNYSDGIISCVINNKPYFIGIIDGQFSKSRSTACFVKLNNNSGNIEIKKSLCGNTLKFESNVIEVINYQINKKLVLLKRGRNGELYCLDSLNNIKWVQILDESSSDIKPLKLAVTANGNIWVSALEYIFNNSSPYVSSSSNNSIIYQISTLGVILNKTYQSTSSNISVEFLVQNNAVYHLYKSATTVRIMKLNATGATEFNLNMPVMNYTNNNFVSNASSNLSFISGTTLGGNQSIIKFSDVLGGIVDIKTYNMSGVKISCSASVNASKLLIGAKNNSGKSMVFCHNSTINDTIWRYIESASISENQIKIIVPKDTTSCYLLSNSSSDIIVRKINTNTGVLIWKTTYNGSLSGIDFGQDLSYDENRNLIIVSGYETYGNTNNQVPLILKLDTLGVIIDTFMLLNAASYNKGTFNEILSLPDGTVLSCGSFKPSINGNSAVINKVSNPVIHSYQTVNQCSNFVWSVNGNNYTNSGNYSYFSFNKPDSIFHLNLSINNSSFVDFQNNCNSFTWQINNQTYTQSGQYTDTIVNAVGCDSIVTLNLTILQSTSGIDTQTVCDSLTWIDGNTYYSNNTTATHLLTNSVGCDSIVTLNLTILQSTSGIDTQTVCDSLTWIDGNTYYSNNSTATHMLTNSVGCDSIVALNLTILQSTSGIDTQTVCDSLTWIDGNTYYSNNTTATHMLTNSVGCDSIVTLNLTILQSTSGIDTQTVCDSLTWIDGNTYYSNNTTATHLLTNAVGCDSIVSLNLTILQPTSGIDTHSVCDSLTWIDGNTYYSNNTTATHVLTNALGCDSIITLDLTIIPTQISQTTIFSSPSSDASCTGQLAISTVGNPNFEISIDGSTTFTSSGYSLQTNLCPGIYDVSVIDYCGDTVFNTAVISTDTNFVFNNPFIDSIAVDSLGTTITNCDIYYNSIDTAFIDSLWATGNQVNVIWNIIDSSGSNLDTITYNLINGNGVYWLQLSIFCPFKSIDENFTVTQAIYFENGTAHIVGLDEHNEQLNSFLLYPNPTTNLVTITYKSTVAAKVLLFDAQGKFIQERMIYSGGGIDLDELERGVYFVSLELDGKAQVKRIIKQ